MTLKQETFAAGRWTAISALLVSGLQILQVAILARMLAPADFGLMAVTASILAVLGLFADLGLSRAIIHFEVIPTNDLHTLYWLNILMGISLTIGFALAVPWLGHAFNLEGLPDVLLAVSPFFILSAFGQQYCALAEKELRFQALAKKEIISALAGFMTAAAVAAMGGGVFALAFALLASTAVGSFIAWHKLSMDYRPKLHLMISEARPYLRFGQYLVGESVLNTLLRQADVFIAGLFSSPAKLGFYSLPRDLSLRIGLIVNPIITRVGFPVMSRMQSDVNSLRSVYMQTLRMTTSTNFPIYVAIGLFSSEIVAFLYGPQWHEAANYLRILAAWGLLRSIGNPVGSLLHAVGAVRLAFWWNVSLLALLVPLYWIAAHQRGLQGLSMMMFALHIAFIPLMWRFLVRPACGAAFYEYLQQIVTPLILALAAGAIALLATFSITHGIPRILIGCSIGGGAYLALSRAFNRQWFNAIRALLHFSLPKDISANP